MSADLAKLQRWFQTRTMSGATADAKREILPSKTLAPDVRLGLYAGMYFLRLRDAMLSDFKAVHALLGADEFDRVVQAYVDAHPSRHPSLNYLGDRFPDFLAGPIKVKKKALLRDVARIELAMTQVFDAPRSEALDPKALEKVPADAWGGAKLRLIAALQLHALEHSVNPLVTAVRGDGPVPPAPKKKSWVAVYRKNYTVWRMDLTEPMYRVLTAFQEGETLERAILAAGVDDPASVFAWFHDWRQEGLFAGIDLPRPAAQRRRASRARV